MSDERIVKSSDTERENRVPPGQKITDNWPVLHLGSMPDIDINKWTFTISGLVERRRELSFEEFMSLPRIKVFSDIH
jgi:DMSO/TMAO reductase YedYZ molybdopterin-dependent catalytic subunit